MALAPLHDPAAAARLVEQAVALGCRAVLVPSDPTAGPAPDAQELQPFWAALEDAATPFVLHVATGGPLVPRRWRGTSGSDAPVSGGDGTSAFELVLAGQAPERFLTAMVLGGVLTRHPRLRGLCLEQGAGWVPPWLRTLDGVHAAYARAGLLAELPETPSAQVPFLALLADEPALLTRLAQRLAGQLSSGERLSPRALGVVAVVDGATPHLTAALHPHLPGAVVLDGTGDAGRWAQELEDAERCGGVLLACGEQSTPWQAFCWRTADRVVVAEDGRASWQHGTRRQRLHGADDVRVLARRLAGTSPGIVLSGGGARGTAHLGVLAALEAAGLRPQRWGGCSMGAFVSALAATGRSADEVARTCRTELLRWHPRRDVTLPRQALSRGSRLQALLLRAFGSLRVGDLAADWFCVSADLGTGELVVHRDGLVRDAVLASMSIPALVPPVRQGERLLVDGGVLDNLPVDVMASTGEGPVVAVDVMRRSASAVTDRPPTLLDVVAQALTIGGRERVRANLELASAVVTPALGDAGLLDFDRLDRCADAGARAVREQLDALRPLWGQAPSP